MGRREICGRLLVHQCNRRRPVPNTKLGSRVRTVVLSIHTCPPKLTGQPLSTVPDFINLPVCNKNHTHNFYTYTESDCSGYSKGPSPGTLAQVTLQLHAANTLAIQKLLGSWAQLDPRSGRGGGGGGPRGRLGAGRASEGRTPRSRVLAATYAASATWRPMLPRIERPGLHVSVFPFSAGTALIGKAEILWEAPNVRAASCRPDSALNSRLGDLVTLSQISSHPSLAVNTER